jgi:hypothetical protein
MLLVIPRRVWKGIKWGKNRWFVLLLPVLLVCAIICAAWGLIIMLIFPSACVKDRSDKIESSSQLKDHCRDLINSRYDRICRQIEEFKSEYEHRNYQYVCESRRYLEHLDQETIKKKLEYAKVTVMETNTLLTNLQEEQIQKINELKDVINDCDRKSANAYKRAEFSAKFAADPDDSVDSVISDIESDYEAFNKRNVRKKARAHKELKYVEALMKITTHRIRMQAIAVWYEDCIIGGSH